MRLPFGRRGDFVEVTLHSLANAMERAGRADFTGVHPGFLQRFDPRAKIVGLLALLIASVITRRLEPILAILTLAATLAATSGVFKPVAKLWGGILLFTGAVALPALFTTPGPGVWKVPGLGWAATATGCRSALFLLARAETTASLASLAVLTTPWPRLLKALRALGAPEVAVAILTMTYRYIFLLLTVAGHFFEARRARTVGAVSGAARRRMAVSAAGVLLGKSMQLGGEVYDAMLARGFRGAPRTLDEFQMTTRDWVLVGAMVTLALVVAAGFGN